MNKISVAIITQNEEANIRGCLESVRFADDVVVVDSGSSDRTLKICEEFPVRVFGEEWKGFARQKNSAVAKTRHEWVLSLDADERVTAGLKEEIFRTLEADPPLDGYFVARKNFFLGRWIKRCGWYPDHNLRLFRKGRGAFEEREVHERVKVRGRVGYLKEPMEHHTYRTLSDYLLRLDRYSSLAAREMRGEGRRFSRLDWFFRPPLTFLQMYLLRAGFLEGYLGLLLSVLYSFYTLAKYSKLKEIQDLEDARPAK